MRARNLKVASIQRVTSGANQSKAKSCSLPYGNTLWEDGTGDRFRWVGAWGYRAISLLSSSHYIRARHYSNKTATWTTTDPLWPDESAYGYAINSPIDFVDPHGLQAVDPAYGIDYGFGIKRTGLSEYEAMKCLIDWAIDCRNCLKSIYNRAGKVYKGASGYPNSMRHCVGTCLAAQQCGVVCSKLVIFHEVQTWLTVDSKRDRHNNNIGLEIGYQNPPKDCHKECGKKHKSGLLW
jgi:RHS repeat-associated protein